MGALTLFLEAIEETTSRTGRQLKKGWESGQESLGPVNGPPKWAAVEEFSVRTAVLAASFAAWSEALRPQMAARGHKSCRPSHGGQHRSLYTAEQAGRTPPRDLALCKRASRMHISSSIRKTTMPESRFGANHREPRSYIACLQMHQCG